MTDSEVDLTAFEHLIQAERNADEARRFHEAEAAKYRRARDEIREQIGKLMGLHNVALVNGKEAMRKTSSKQFAEARFREEFPDFYNEYKVRKSTWKVDTERLADELPQIYARFTTTRWTNSSEVLG